MYATDGTGTSVLDRPWRASNSPETVAAEPLGVEQPERDPSVDKAVPPAVFTPGA